MMKQAQDLQKQLAQAQERIDSLEIEGISGGGVVSVVLKGNGTMKTVSIHEDLWEKEKDREMLEDLIVAAHNDAWEKLEKKKSGEMGELPMGKLPFGLG